MRSKASEWSLVYLSYLSILIYVLRNHSLAAILLLYSFMIGELKISSNSLCYAALDELEWLLFPLRYQFWFHQSVIDSFKWYYWTFLLQFLSFQHKQFQKKKNEIPRKWQTIKFNILCAPKAKTNLYENYKI